MANGSAQLPFFAHRASASDASRAAAHSLSEISADTMAAPCASKLALYRDVACADEDQRRLPAVALGRVVARAQVHLAAGERVRQRLLRRRGRLDAEQAHLASVIETDAACIDDLGNAAFALRFELTRSRKCGAMTRHEERCCDHKAKDEVHVAQSGCVTRQLLNSNAAGGEEGADAIDGKAVGRTFRRRFVPRHCEERDVRPSSKSEGGSDEAMTMSRHVGPRTIPLCGKRATIVRFASRLTLAALSRMRHDRANTQNQAAIRARRSREVVL